MVDDDVL